MDSAATIHLLSIAFCAGGAIAIFAAVAPRSDNETPAAPSTGNAPSSVLRQSIALLGLFALLDGFLLQFIATLETFRP
jgi:hypothetical protein